MTASEFLAGHDPIGRRPNIKQEITRIRRDPLESFVLALDEAPGLFSSDISRYYEAYSCYVLAMQRFLENMSITARHMNGVHLKRNATSKLTPYQRRLSDKYRTLRPYLEFDIANCLLHTRILLDRVAGLSRRFLRLPRAPSFTSFSDHKKFFERQASPLPQHEDYAEYLRNHTEWFEMPIKMVRDKFVVHASPKHMRFVVLPNSHEVQLTIVQPDKDSPDKPLAKATMIRVNPLRMSYDVEAFLKWFSAYGCTAVSMVTSNI